MKKLILGMAAATLLFSACKDSDDDNNSVSRKVYLTNGKWELTAGSAVVLGQQIEVLSQLPDCNKDDRAVFRETMRFILDAGATKCDVNEPQESDLGNWELQEYETKLKFPLEAIFPDQYDISINSASNIDYLDNKTMKLSGSGTQSVFGTPTTFSYNLTLTNVK